MSSWLDTSLGDWTTPPTVPPPPRHCTRMPGRGRDRSGDVVGYQVELLEPGGRLAVAGRPEVTTRGQRAARADLGRIRDAAALELAQSEEALDEQAQVGLDVGQLIFVAPVDRDVRPRAPLLVAPRRMREEGDLRRRVPEAEDVVEVEVLELVRADDSLCRLGRARIPFVPRHQLRRDVRVEDLHEERARLRPQLL